MTADKVRSPHLERKAIRGRVAFWGLVLQGSLDRDLARLAVVRVRSMTMPKAEVARSRCDRGRP